LLLHHDGVSFVKRPRRTAASRMNLPL